MDSCDLLIVGGGPAGSTCARLLVDAGMDVVLLDKATFPRDKPCAGWITPPVVELLRLDVDAYRAGGRVCQPIRAFRTSRLGRAAVDTDFGETVSYGILRRELDHYLLERCGARVHTGVPFESLRRDTSSSNGDGDGRGAGDWIVNETIRAPLVIGAGGHFCPVAKRIAAFAHGASCTHGDAHAASSSASASAPASESVVAAQEIEVRMTPAQAAACPVSGDRPELFLCEDFKGYGWCFRKGDVLNVGLGRLDSHRLAAHVRAFADRLVADGRIPADLAWRWKGHAYLVREASPRPLVADGLLLIGDAAGLAYGRSGEGIRPAVESARLAADTILAARGAYTRGRLDPYRLAIEARLGHGLDARPAPGAPLASPSSTSDRVDAAVPAPGLAERVSLAVATTLMSSRWFTRHVLLRRWFLHAQDPPLAASSGSARS